MHRRAVGRQRNQVVADVGNLLDQVLAGRIVPAVNRMGGSAMPAILPDSIRGSVVCPGVSQPCKNWVPELYF